MHIGNRLFFTQPGDRFETTSVTMHLKQCQPRAERGFKSPVLFKRAEMKSLLCSFIFLHSLHTPPPPPPILFSFSLLEVWHKFLSSSLAVVAMVVSVPPNYLGWYFHGHRSGWHRALRCRREAVHWCQQFCVLETDWRRQSSSRRRRWWWRKKRRIRVCVDIKQSGAVAGKRVKMRVRGISLSPLLKGDFFLFSLHYRF